MKNFLKRANRGLILGGIVLIGFIAYVIADTAAFKKNKPQIETAVSDYLDALSECAVTSGSWEDFQAKADKHIAEYWCPDSSSGNTDYYGFTMSSYKNQLEAAMEEEYSGENTGKVTKWNAKPYDIGITKAGTGYARVMFSCDITAEFSGDPYLVTPCEIMKISDFLYYESNELAENVPSQFSITIDFELKMKETDGKWKVCYTESWGWLEPSITVSDETEGGNE